MEQIIRYRAVRVVADRTVFFNWSVLMNKRALLVRVTLVTRHVDRLTLQVSLVVAVGIMASRTRHLALTDWVVRRQLSHSVNILVTFKTNIGVVDRHGHSRRPTKIRVIDAY